MFLLVQEESMSKRVLCLVLGLMMSCNSIAYADEIDIADEIKETSVITLSDKANEILKRVRENVDIKYLTYEEAADGILSVLNERDSYFYSIENPDETIKYLRNNIELPRNLDTEITRLEFCKLFLDIATHIGDKPYTSDLIDISDIFIDLDGLEDEDKEIIKTIFIEGVLSGVSEDKFKPDGFITQSQFNIILDRIRDGYSRKYLFNVVDSAFSVEDREAILGGKEDRNLTYNDIIVFLNDTFKNPIINWAQDINKEITVREFLMEYQGLFKGDIIKYNDELDEFYYPAKDTVILSAEEWEYLNSNLDKVMLYSEAQLLYERSKKAQDDFENYKHFDSFEEIEHLTNNYLGFVSELVYDTKGCINYFMDYSEPKFAIWGNYGDFSRAVHESQHEKSARLSGDFSHRVKRDDLWLVYWGSRPSTFYYFDMTNGNWVDNRNTYSYNTSNIYNKYCPDEVKEDSFMKLYATDNDLISNIYGLQGLLQEFCSYALQAKIEFINTSLGVADASVGCTNYDWYLMLKYLSMQFIEHIEENNSVSYETIMSDMDMVRFINNTMREMDEYEKIFADRIGSYTSWFADDLLLWGYELGAPVSFKDLDNLLDSDPDIEISIGG